MTSFAMSKIKLHHSPIYLSLHASLSRPSIFQTQNMSFLYIYILNTKYGTLDYLLGGIGNYHSGYIRRKRRNSITPSGAKGTWLCLIEMESFGTVLSSFGYRSASIIFQLSSYLLQDLIPFTMPSSISITFESLLEIALGKTQDVTNVTNKDIPEITQYLKKKITAQNLQNVNEGLDPENPGTAFHRRSLNHTAKLWKLRGVSKHASTCKTTRRQRQVKSGRALICANSPHFRVARSCTAQ